MYSDAQSRSKAQYTHSTGSVEHGIDGGNTKATAGPNSKGKAGSVDAVDQQTRTLKKTTKTTARDGIWRA